MRLGLPKARGKECIHLCSHSGPIHGLTWRILMGERWFTQRRVARAMRGAIDASTIWPQRARGTLLAWPKHACGAFLRACVHEHATQDGCSARHDAF